MTNQRTRWLALGAVAAIAGALASAHVASAHGGFGRLGRGGGDRQALLAKALGITVDQLEAAQDEAFEKGLAQAVEAGDVEQADADLMLARRKLQRAVDHQAVMAEALGTTVDELAKAREAGTTMRDLLDRLGVDEAALPEKLRAAHEAAVDEAVADGVITRAQADQLEDARGRGFGRFRRGHGPLAPKGGGAGIGRPAPAAPLGGQDL